MTRGNEHGGATGGPRVLRYVRLSDVSPVTPVRITADKSLPIFARHLIALVGAGESGKSMLAARVAADVADGGDTVLILDGEMSAQAWRARLDLLGVSRESLARICYVEMDGDAADTQVLIATARETGARLITWDSALSLLSRAGVGNENDNVAVSTALSRLRPVLRDCMAAGLLIDHTPAGSGDAPPRQRGATAKFNEVDLVLGVSVVAGSVPSREAPWEALVTIEKDRHGLLETRRDYSATFVPIAPTGLQVEIVEVATTSNRFTKRASEAEKIADLVIKIAGLVPPPSSGNDAAGRLGGTRRLVLAAFKVWAGQ